MQKEKQDYYVYVFKRKDNDAVFYVGSGRLNRVNQKSSRNKECSEIMSTIGYYHEIIHDRLSRQEAREIEEAYIKSPLTGWKLTNKRLPTKTNELDTKVLAEFFYYDPTSPSGLRYAKNTYKNRGALIKSKDEVAGRIFKTKDGKALCWRVNLNINKVKYTFKVHRIIWCLLNEEIDEDLVIDHIDNNPLNNNIDNLRLIAHHVNTRNKKPPRTRNSTGIVGISINKGNQYNAEIIDIDGNRRSKSFSINKYGKEKALYLAAKARYEYLMSQPEHLRFSDTHSCIEELIKIITNFENKVNHEFDNSILSSRQFSTTESKGSC